MSYQVRLPVFAGPLDLLLHLIERAEIDIYDIPIASIAEQFLAYLRAMEWLNLEMAGEFLVMAATLMAIKAKMLLPKPVDLGEGDLSADEDEDPRRELVDRLVEYKRIKEASLLLKRLEDEQSLFYPRSGGEFADRLLAPGSNPLLGLSLWDLIEAFQSVLASANPEEPEVPIPGEEISVKQVMDEIIAALATAGGTIPFARIFGAERTRRLLITSFISLLELMRLGRVMAIQEGVFGQIILRAVPHREGSI